jgi:hypothetical protein
MLSFLQLLLLLPHHHHHHLRKNKPPKFQLQPALLLSFFILLLLVVQYSGVFFWIKKSPKKISRPHQRVQQSYLPHRMNLQILSLSLSLSRSLSVSCSAAMAEERPRHAPRAGDSPHKLCTCCITWDTRINSVSTRKP